MNLDMNKLTGLEVTNDVKTELSIEIKRPQSYNTEVSITIKRPKSYNTETSIMI